MISYLVMLYVLYIMYSSYTGAEVAWNRARSNHHVEASPLLLANLRRVTSEVVRLWGIQLEWG